MSATRFSTQITPPPPPFHPSESRNLCIYQYVLLLCYSSKIYIRNVMSTYIRNKKFNSCCNRLEFFSCTHALFNSNISVLVNYTNRFNGEGEREKDVVLKGLNTQKTPCNKIEYTTDNKIYWSNGKYFYTRAKHLFFFFTVHNIYPW